MSSTLDIASFRAMYKGGTPKEEILQMLVNSGLEVSQAEEMINGWQKAQQSARTSTGFMVTGTGAIICIFSCVITMLQLAPGMNGILLYGLTTVGAIIIMAGLWMIFET